MDPHVGAAAALAGLGQLGPVWDEGAKVVQLRRAGMTDHGVWWVAAVAGQAVASDRKPRLGDVLELIVGSAWPKGVDATPQMAELAVGGKVGQLVSSDPGEHRLSRAHKSALLGRDRSERAEVVGSCQADKSTGKV
jgi:hypothetical protein